MMRKELVSGLALTLALAGGPALAGVCESGAVPAATLLLPYFEVDLDNPQGVTTLFSINNAEPTPALAHVVFWTDWSYPTLSFDVYLTGYDVVSVNLREVFDGDIPITADAPNDPQQDDPQIFCGIRSPCGGAWSFNPHWDDHDPVAQGAQGFAFCEQIFPGFLNPVIVGNAKDRIRSGHTGGVVASEDACIGFDHGDGKARGYVTVDSVSECSLAVQPGDMGFGDTPYFVNGGEGVANNDNRLWGDWFLVDLANDFAQGDSLVHIEADAELFGPEPAALETRALETRQATAPTTGYTFYGRYLFPKPSDGRDNREPLGTIWGGRYLNGGTFDRTDFLVWRDSTSGDLRPLPQGHKGDWCRLGPSWYPLNETEVLAFNESEDAVNICLFTGGVITPDEFDPHCFPLGTGRYAWGDDVPLDIPFEFGWAYLNLNLPEEKPILDHDFGADGNLAQSYVVTLHQALGRFSIGLPALEISSACFDFNESLNGSEQNGGTTIIPFF